MKLRIKYPGNVSPVLLTALVFLTAATGCASGFEDSPSMGDEFDEEDWNEHKSPFQERMWSAENPEFEVSDEDLVIDELLTNPDTESDLDDAPWRDDEEWAPGSEIDSP